MVILKTDQKTRQSHPFWKLWQIWREKSYCFLITETFTGLTVLWKIPDKWTILLVKFEGCSFTGKQTVTFLAFRVYLTENLTQRSNRQVFFNVWSRKVSNNCEIVIESLVSWTDSRVFSARLVQFFPINVGWGDLLVRFWSVHVANSTVVL